MTESTIVQPIARPSQRLGPGLVAGVCALAGAWLAAMHPLSGAAAVALFLGGIALSAWRPTSGLGLLLTALPMLGLHPWTGWRAFDELDLAVLATAAGGYGRWAFAPRALRPLRAPPGVLAIVWWLAAAAALGVSTGVGLADAGGLRWSLWHGYQEPMNSLRPLTSFVLASLLWPLTRHMLATAPDATTVALRNGLTGGLVLAGAAALWERLAFTGLLDFSSDYRTTALFWEMHVGGAAFDGFLALTLPFALAAWQATRRPLHWALATAALLLATYACLTTFSRGVYAAIPAGAIVLLLLDHARRRRAAPQATAVHALPAALLIAVFAVGAWLMFPTSGYRGAIAWWGGVVVALVLLPRLPTLTPIGWAAGLAGGTLAIGAAVLLSGTVPKGAYLAFAASSAIALGLCTWARIGPWLAAAALAAASAAWGSVALVALHWGGVPGLRGAAAALAMLAFVLAVATFVTLRSGRSAWPASWRWQGSVAALMLLLAAGLGVALGGGYIGSRFSTTAEDLAGREQHWARGLGLLQGERAWAAGIGTGRFPAHFARAVPSLERPADARLIADADGERVVIASGAHVNGWGEIYRLSQRVEPPQGTTRLTFAVRNREALTVHAEVCEKHLIYSRDCLIGKLQVPAGDDTWRPMQLTLQGKSPTRGLAFAPRLVAFSIAVETPGRRAEFDDLSLTDSMARELLANGRFTQGLAHWFVTSDRHHLPWHAKNMGLHLLIEQGLLGTGLFGLLIVAAGWRVAFGRARDHALAPPLAAALIGFLIVGAADSLLDAPRIAMLFTWLLFVALSLPSPREARDA